MNRSSSGRYTHAANRLGLDYRAEAAKFKRFSSPLIDIHTHINGARAARIFKDVMDLFGIGVCYSMTRGDQIDVIQELLGDRVRFIAIPDYRSGDLLDNVTTRYMKRIEALYQRGVRIVKFWSAPRGIDLARNMGYPGALKLDAPHLREVMRFVREMGMLFMVHVGDPDTWFATKYADSTIYGSKESQYMPLRRMLDDFPNPCIAAHMGGWPENLPFLSRLLESHANLYLDSSATKWMVRELSRYRRDDVLAFFQRWQGRILFGSDIVTGDEHLGQEGEQMVFDLYASRFWALRTMFETGYRNESPIVDPDLAMVDPASYGEFAAPILEGRSFPDELLESLYFGAARALLGPYESGGRNG